MRAVLVSVVALLPLMCVSTILGQNMNLTPV